MCENNNNNHIQIDPERLRQLNQERKRKILQIRMGQGLKQLFKKPLKNIPVAILIILFVVAMAFRGNVMNIVGTVPQFLTTIWGYTVTAMISLVFVLLFAGLIYLIGTPSKARKTENSLLQVFLSSNLRYGFHPILISREPYKGAEKLEFYSKGIDLQVWEERQSAIAAALVCRFLEPINYGGRNNNNGNRIVICVGKGMNPLNRGVMTDDCAVQKLTPLFLKR